MRLINCNTDKFEEFFNEETPPYAILSHTWEAHEISFKEYFDPKTRQMHPKAAEKITSTIAKVSAIGLEYVWIGKLSMCNDSRKLNEIIL